MSVMRKRAVRYAFLMHRWLGIMVGAMMVVWCLSGMVMLWKTWPQPDAARSRLAHEVIQFTAPPVLPVLDAQYRSFRLTMAGGVPVLQAETLGGILTSYDLHNGHRLADTFAATDPSSRSVASDRLTPEALSGNALRYARSIGDRGALRFSGIRQVDQWIINTKGHERGFYRYDSDAAPASILYLSPVTGDIVQATTSASRFWSWLGAIPHWLYPSLLRRHPALWADVLIALSGAGIFLTGLGLWIGWRRLNAGRHLSPYKGAHLIHHCIGLVFGPLLLSWIVSGFLTMNPAGFLSRGAMPEWTTAIDRPVDPGLLRSAMIFLRDHPQRRFRDLEIVSPGGVTALIATTPDGKAARLNLAFDPAPLTANAVENAIKLAGITATATWLDHDDRFYFSTRHLTRPFPVWRLTGADGVHLYLDARTGLPLLVVDAAARGSRWIIYGPHDLDFFIWLRQPLARLVLIMPLLAGISTICLSGFWIGLRRLLRRKRPANRHAASRALAREDKDARQG